MSRPGLGELTRAPGPGAWGDPRPGPWLALSFLPLVTLAIPSALVLAGPLASNGWPARLLIFAIAGAVLLGWLRRPAAGRRTSPAEAGCWILLLGVMVSFAAAQLRPLTGVEFAGSVRVALVIFPLIVVALGIASLGDAVKADMLLTYLLAGAVLSTLVALAQFVVPFDLAELIRPPGFVAREVGGMGDRGGFIRVKGTATHPIEYGVISGALTPVALHFARFGSTAHRRRLALLVAGLLAMGLLLSVTRSAVLTLVVAILVYAVNLTLRERLNLLVVGLGALVLVRATLPGLLGTITGFFLGAAEDDSVTARLADYPLVDRYFAEAPWIGRGLGTFLPDEYVLLDNQYLMSLVEGGLVLVVAIIAFFALTLASARGAVLRAASPSDASRAQAVTASIASIAVSGLLFDLFSFAQVTVVLFLLVGIAGVLWHDGRENGLAIPEPIQRFRTPPAEQRRAAEVARR
ncbi:O-antigen ligase family protein [Georgenia sp. EYE_87]|uniref:O-antigen ligase family protein n=1 Tax=Georgenia sp. EYE_87 TaxID=2853448 RepID=UPI0020051ABD|nr:O-antigen ligase family protein [Georgenia sp. EYE_87]MCK6211021.1 O-antigen ligase family protein [Georgenia sp. EYE_87]